MCVDCQARCDGDFAGHGYSNPTYEATQWLTLREVADLLDKHIDTAKDYRAENRWPHAKQDENGRRAWCVPVSDLVAAGDLDLAQVASVAPVLDLNRESKEVAALREERIRLTAELEAAKALAEERRETVALLKSGLPRSG